MKFFTKLTKAQEDSYNEIDRKIAELRHQKHAILRQILKEQDMDGKRKLAFLYYKERGVEKVRLVYVLEWVIDRYSHIVRPIIRSVSKDGSMGNEIHEISFRPTLDDEDCPTIEYTECTVEEAREILKQAKKRWELWKNGITH